jgi:hypothetical protein
MAALMKVGSKKMFKEESFENRIERLKKEIQLLESLVPLRNYFALNARYQSSYLVEMRKVTAHALFDKGLSYSEIGRVLSRSHGAILHLFKITSAPEVVKVIKKNYKEWLENNRHPMPLLKWVPSDVHRQGWQHKTDYKLITL